MFVVVSVCMYASVSVSSVQTEAFESFELVIYFEHADKKRL